MPKTALITGVTGQDGSFLAEFLLEKGYAVHGVARRTSTERKERIEHLRGRPHFFLHYGDMTDSMSLIKIIGQVQPDEIYNLAAQSHVHVSFDVPEFTANADGIGTLRILESVRLLGLEKKCRIYQASTSELYGKVQEVPQSETTPFYPYSPYAAAKQYAYWISVNYREAYGMFISNGILLNHESERRGETFVTRKITRGVASIALGLQDCLYMGNIDAKRDWGHAKDYVRAMWLILQQEKAEDYVIATGVTTSVRDFIRMAFAEIGVELEFSGIGIEEVAKIKSCSNDEYRLEKGKVVMRINPKYYRPTEVDLLIGDPAKAKAKLGWQPEYDLPALVKDMMESDLELFKREKYLLQGGHKILNRHES